VTAPNGGSVARVRPAELTEELNDVWRLIVGYAKQETVTPLRGIARFAQYGFAGMVCFAIGSGFASLAIIRALQTETNGRLNGNFSFVPYLASIFGLAIVAFVAFRSVRRTPWKASSANSKGDKK
jgi:predicted cation transporter